MKLYLAVAALMLVLIAQSEAEEEPTIEEQFANIHSKLKEFGTDLTEKTTNALKQLEKSEFASKTRSWFASHFDNLKQKFDETFSQ